MDNIFSNEERQFNDDENDDLIDRGFTPEQIQYLESLDLEHEHKYSGICKDMDDYHFTPQQCIDAINDDINAAPEEEELPSQGGKRRRKNKTRRRKQSLRRRKQRKSKRKSRRRK